MEGRKMLTTRKREAELVPQPPMPAVRATTRYTEAAAATGLYRDASGLREAGGPVGRSFPASFCDEAFHRAAVVQLKQQPIPHNPN